MNKEPISIILNDDDTKFKIMYLHISNKCSVKISICKTTNTLYINDLITDSNSRKQGYAKRLLDEVHLLASVNNCKIISLFAEIDSWMKDWYNRLGFIDYSVEYKGFMEMIKIIE